MYDFMRKLCNFKFVKYHNFFAHVPPIYNVHRSLVFVIDSLKAGFHMIADDCDRLRLYGNRSLCDRLRSTIRDRLRSAIVCDRLRSYGNQPLKRVLCRI